MVEIDSCLDAFARLSPYLNPTPLIFSQRYSEMLKQDIYFKFENHFPTGSFKERGALNFLLSLDEEQKKSGVCAASAGNHALALSFHARRLGVKCELVMPVMAPVIKVRACRNQGAIIHSHGDTFDDAQSLARELCERNGTIFVPAFDDPRIIAGQATCGLELLNQLADFDSVIVPVGGGGLISGIATALKAKRPLVKIIGVQSEWALSAQKNPATYLPGLRPLSIADGIAVKRIGVHTAPIIAEKVDLMITVDENEIAESLIGFLENEHILIEGAAAAALAGFHRYKKDNSAARSIVLISGSNIDMNLVSRLIDREMAKQHKVVRLTFSLPDRPGALTSVTTILAEMGVNVLEVQHNRSFSHIPGNVEIGFLIEVRDLEHKSAVIEAVKKQGITLISGEN